jgi:Pyruvate/2-oxoacid:ferredoxin oxidoreductase delta subunit
MMKSVCQPIQCTTCGICKVVCPKSCITEHWNQDGSIYLEYNEELCIDCGLCKKVCPNHKWTALYKPKAAYAAWAVDANTHATGASGGIASVLYQYAVNKGWWYAGVYLNENFEAHYQLSNNLEDVARFKNSKYTHSFLDDTPVQIKNILMTGKTVLFVGLPCQVASLKNYVDTFKYSGRLITVDLVCHGTPPSIYLQQHVAFIEKITGKKAKSLFFRDPVYKTGKYAFTIYAESIFAGGKFAPVSSPTYIKYVGDDDMYQIGYHNALIYQNCCYQCKYAIGVRVGDLTLSDYNGLGMKSAYNHNREQVSCVLTNTETGEELWKSIQASGLVESYVRPLAEPLKYTKQLNSPSVAPGERKQFLEEYKKAQDYDKAASIAFRSIIAKRKLENAIPLKKLAGKIVRVATRTMNKIKG